MQQSGMLKIEISFTTFYYLALTSKDMNIGQWLRYNEGEEHRR